MKQNPIVALWAPMGSGKSTVAALTGRTRLSFAGPLRATVALAFGVDPAWFARVSSNPQTKNVPHQDLMNFAPRELLIRIGTKWFRELHTDFWVKRMVPEIERARRRGEDVVIDDCRFLNEANLVKSLGGIVVGIERPGALLDAPPNASEKDLYDYWTTVPDLYLSNHLGLDELRKTVLGFTFQTFGPGDNVRLRSPATTEQRGTWTIETVEGERYGLVKQGMHFSTTRDRILAI